MKVLGISLNEIARVVASHRCSPSAVALAPLLLLLLPLASACESLAAAPAAAALPGACAALNQLRDTTADIGPTLVACVNQTPAGGQVLLAPGKYHLTSVAVIARSVTIRTAGMLTAAAPPCDEQHPRCATIDIDIRPPFNPAWKNQMPIEITADNVTLDHLIITGSRGQNLATDNALCAPTGPRSMGGGLRITGSHDVVTNSSVDHVTCYSAMEVRSKTGFVAEHDFIAFNGDHAHHDMWSDGMTVQEAADAHVEYNQFVDNTDVQLIFGGCQNCVVAHNSLSHDGSPAGGSFADLMIHSFARATSGQYAGTTFSYNTINCGPAKACGFGLMIGPDPWYQGSTAGGTVAFNTVENAMLGLNIDNLSGPMTIMNNRILNSGGQFISTCGMRNAAAVNISPASRKYVDVAAIETSAGVKSDTQEFAGCILNHPANAPAAH